MKLNDIKSKRINTGKLSYLKESSIKLLDTIAQLNSSKWFDFSNNPISTANMLANSCYQIHEHFFFHMWFCQQHTIIKRHFLPNAVYFYCQNKVIIYYDPQKRVQNPIICCLGIRNRKVNVINDWYLQTQ